LLQFSNLPEPLVNTHLEGEEPDFHWPEHKLAVEVDGPGHARPRTKRDDARKAAILSAAGYRILRFTDDDLEQRPDHVITRLRAVLEPEPRILASDDR